MKRNNLIVLLEGAVMIALATILSLITIIRMPFGGGITAASMIPIVLVAYRRKIKWGTIIALTYGALQLLLGMENLQYATSFAAVCAIVFLDYIAAFAVLGLGGFFRDKMMSQTRELILGTSLACLLRYTCHVVAGCTVWAGVSIPTSDGLIYSLAYNAAYMIPETIITIAGIWYLSKMIDFRSQKLSANVSDKEDRLAGVLDSVGVLSIVLGIVFTALYCFRSMQGDEGFDITGILNINPVLLLGVLGGTILLWIILHLISKRRKSKA